MTAEVQSKIPNVRALGTVCVPTHPCMETLELKKKKKFVCCYYNI